MMDRRKPVIVHIKSDIYLARFGIENKMSSLNPWVGGRSMYDPLSMDLFDPFSVVTNSWLSDLGRRRQHRDDTAAITQARVDWNETPGSHIFRADIPGVKKNEVKVQVEDGNILNISGERTKVEESETDTWHRAERRHGSFLRRFKLPENANMEAIQCDLDHGVLTVTVRKKETKKLARNIRDVNIRDVNNPN